MNQSPINLSDGDIRVDLGLQRSNHFQFEYNCQDCVLLSNIGHTWKLATSPDSKSVLKGGHLPDSYRLDHVHAHWGTASNNGSEHLVNGNGYAGEIHIVHFNTKYSTLQDALKYPDGLAVLGVFLKESKNDNAVLESIVQILNRVSYKDQSVRMERGFEVVKLIPENRDFWTYNGSLTTPPCCECVIWTIFRTPIPISTRQMDVFRSLYAVPENEAVSNPIKMVNNIRSVQQLNKRIVWASFTNTINSHAYHFHNSSIF